MALGTIAGTPAWHPKLYAAGHQYTTELASWMADVDPAGSVRVGSRYLCTSLSQLARTCYRSLGGSQELHKVGRAAAMLSLLTKIDDQVIDDRDFHRMSVISAPETRARVRAYMTPTLTSLVTGTPTTPAPRCAFAAELGQELQALSAHPARLARLLQWIAWGWEVQAQAVATLASQPSQVTAEQVAAISAQISGAWLLMITMVGTLPADAARGLTLEEEAAYIAWGRTIQATDALTDLEKDIHDGLCATVPGMHIWQQHPSRFTLACQNLDIPALYRMACDTQADLRCLPSTREANTLSAGLARLPQLASLLRWIQGFLLWRYIQHPLCQQRPNHPAFAGLLDTPTDWSAYLGKIAAAQPQGAR